MSSLLPSPFHIDVNFGRCAVARLRKMKGGHLVTEYAENWEALESRARQEVLDQGGRFDRPGMYAISNDLALAGEFPLASKH